VKLNRLEYLNEPNNHYYFCLPRFEKRRLVTSDVHAEYSKRSSEAHRKNPKNSILLQGKKNAEGACMIKY